MARFPDIVLDVQIDNGLADIVAGGFDAGIRLGHALQRDMVSVPLEPLQQLVVVASPTYLEADGPPRSPKGLLQHRCIRQRLGSGARFLEWKFTSGAKTTTIDVHGRLLYNEMRPALAAARAGCGLAYVFRPSAAPDLRAASRVNKPWRYPAFALHSARVGGRSRSLTTAREAAWGSRIFEEPVHPPSV